MNPSDAYEEGINFKVSLFLFSLTDDTDALMNANSTLADVTGTFLLKGDYERTAA